MKEVMVVRYGEIALKGKNIGVFQKKFVKNIKKSLIKVPTADVFDHHGRVYVHYEKETYDSVVSALSKVFGIVSISPSVRVDNSIEAIKEAALGTILRLQAEENIKSFKIQTKRVNKGFPMKTPEINQEVGGYVLENSKGLHVDVHKPDVMLTFEIRNVTYMFSKTIQGLGGMPYGSAGKGLLLLSGGIDSPVSGYLMARRGLELEAIHFHSYPFTSERAMEKVVELGRKLTEYTINLKIHKINLLDIQTAINHNCPSEEMTILSRCFMMKIAERICEDTGCKCLVTGENMGQVASQTLEGLTVTDSMTHLPVMRPLIAYDKNEIIDIAKQIDTFETSILPFEDCCTVFLPDRVVTKPRVEKIQSSLALLDVDGLIQKAVEEKEVIIISE